MLGQPWRLLDFENTDPYMNLALEEAIMSCIGKRSIPCSLRYWRNSKAVIIGAFQCAEHEVDLNDCQQKNIPVIRRISGGGAVYHDLGNLNYSIYVTTDHSFYNVYQDTSLAIVKALHSLNLDARQVSQNTIQVNERKISGLAGAMKSGAILIHGSLLINTNLEVLSDMLDLRDDFVVSTTSKRKFVRSNKKKVINLYDALGYEICFSKVKKVLQRSFESVFSVTFSRSALSDHEKQLANKLYSNKYRLFDWNFKY
jgi:lipoate-protein ligase A